MKKLKKVVKFTKKVILMALIVPLVFACDSDLKPNENRKIISLEFKASNNVALSSDVSGIIKGNYIEVVVPKGTNITSLVSDVDFVGKRIKPDIGTSINYTQLVTYAVLSEEESNNVTVYIIDVHHEGTESREDIVNIDDGVVVKNDADDKTNDETTTTTTTTRPKIHSDSPIILGYFPSWSENWASEGKNSKLREIPSYVNHVFLSFAKSNMRYTKGSYDLSETGIQTPYKGPALVESIKALSDKGINVILSIGGETYWNSSDVYDIDYQSIKDFVDDFGLAGIDWDYEPNGSFSGIGTATNVAHFIDFIKKSRAIMPKGEYLITCAPSGVGAVGGQTNDDAESPYAFANRNTLTGESDANLYDGTVKTNGINIFGFSATGHMIPVFKAVGDMIDMVAYQGYNLGGSTNRTIMYDAFSHYADIYGFDVVAGVHYPDEPWGPYYEYTHENMASLSKHIYDKPKGDRKDGIMIWELLLKGASSSAYSYLNVASYALAGRSEAEAVSNANNFLMEPYSGGSEVSVDPKTTEGETATGTTHCGFAEWNKAKEYSTSGSKVYYKGKIWTNGWWLNGESVPGEQQYNGWTEVSTCSE